MLPSDTLATGRLRATSLVPLTIIGGFLGSGKTSLVNHILNHAVGRRVAVLVNDFGSINIDAKLIVSVEGETISLANGCVCCTIRHDLLVEVIKLLERDPVPDHIVIETSGVSRPVAVAETFFSSTAQRLVDVQHMISMLDADLTVDPKAGYGDLAFDQIKTADIIVINKIDLVAPRQLAELRRRVATIAPRVRTWETSHGIVPLDLIFEDDLSAAMAKLRSWKRESDASVHHEHGPEGHFEAWSYQGDTAWSFNALEQAMSNLPRGIYRAKGFVRLDLDSGDYGILHLTGRRSWLRLCEPSSLSPVNTELIFIGERGTTTDERIRVHLEQSLEEVRRRGDAGYVVKDLRAFNVVFV